MSDTTQILKSLEEIAKKNAKELRLEDFSDKELLAEINRRIGLSIYPSGKEHRHLRKRFCGTCQALDKMKAYSAFQEERFEALLNLHTNTVFRSPT